MPSKKKKPNKRQKAILSLLGIVESEGLHYGLVSYGGDDEVTEIADDELSQLFKSFRETSEKLEEKLEALKSEVEVFLEDDSDF